MTNVALWNFGSLMLLSALGDSGIFLIVRDFFNRLVFVALGVLR